MSSRKQAKERNKRRRLQEEQKKATDRNKTAETSPPPLESGAIEPEISPQCPIIMGWGAHLVMAMIFMPLFRRREESGLDDG